MCVLSVIYNYAAVCRFCTVRHFIIISFSLLISKNSTYFAQYSVFVCFLLCIFVFCFVYFVFLYCFRIALCIVSPFVLSLSIFAQVYRPLSPGGNPIAVNKYHIKYQKVLQSTVTALTKGEVVT